MSLFVTLARARFIIPASLTLYSNRNIKAMDSCYLSFEAHFCTQCAAYNTLPGVVMDTNTIVTFTRHLDRLVDIQGMEGY